MTNSQIDRAISEGRIDILGEKMRELRELRVALKQVREALLDGQWLGQTIAHHWGKQTSLRRIGEEVGEAVIARAWGLEGEHQPASPPVVCLCGSTRFYEAYVEANRSETLAGNIMLAPGVFGGSIHAHLYEDGGLPDEKIPLDELHLRKIDMADEIIVLNVGGYIGESTRNEIVYAYAHKKGIRFLEPVSAEDFAALLKTEIPQ